MGHETAKVFNGTFDDFPSLEDVESKLRRMTERIKKPCAILCLNDRFAVSVCRIVCELGFSMPADVAVMGTGDFDVARIAPTPISSMRTDKERIGYEAARLLHRIFNGEEVSKRVHQLPVKELVVRESTTGKRRSNGIDLNRALEYIRNRACEGIREEDVANYVHMSLWTFELEFARVMGRSVGRVVGEVIREARLARVKDLLMTTDLKLQSVAKLVGLGDAANLNRFMRRWENMSASEYRQQIAD